MPLLDRRQREGVQIGSIRIGTKVMGANGRERPSKLDTFRLTSPDGSKIEAAAALYGGTARPWRPSEGAAQQWEVITTSDRMAVRVPPGSPVVQDYQYFAQPASGRAVVRERLCDGVTERMKGRPCVCPADLFERGKLAAQGGACKPTTQLSVILADLPGLGVWVLTSRGDSAADELAATARFLHGAELAGRMLPAVLRLEQRRSVGSGELHSYAVPVLDVQASLLELETGTWQQTAISNGGGQGGRPAALEAAPAVQAAGPLPDPVGRPGDAGALVVLAGLATDPEGVRELRRIAVARGWLQDYVEGPDGTLSPCETLLYDRLVELGGVSS